MPTRGNLRISRRHPGNKTPPLREALGGCKFTALIPFRKCTPTVRIVNRRSGTLVGREIGRESIQARSIGPTRHTHHAVHRRLPPTHLPQPRPPRRRTPNRKNDPPPPTPQNPHRNRALQGPIPRLPSPPVPRPSVYSLCPQKQDCQADKRTSDVVAASAFRRPELRTAAGET